MPDPDLSRIEAAGRMGSFLDHIRRMENTVIQAPLWRPGAALIRECREAMDQIGAMKARFEKKLVVTLIGPSGSGKSTLFNALAGKDALSEIGLHRPTTQKLIFLSEAESDVTERMGEIGNPNGEIRYRPGIPFLENLILIDTPDTDSMSLETHRELLHTVIPRSDVLICLFDAQNPKRKDHGDFLASYVHHFDGASLIAVLNKCDRLDRKELVECIRPDFSNTIRNFWGKPAQALFCISARRHLQNPGWKAPALPLHDFDEFHALQDTIRNTLGQYTARFDRRLQNARAISEYLSGRVKEEASRDAKNLAHALERIQSLEKKAAETALAAVQSMNTRAFLPVSTRIYQELVHRWTGPVGWIVALWCRLLVFGSGIAAFFRFPKSIREVKKWAAAVRGREDAFDPAFPGPGARQNGAGLKAYRLALVREWGDIAEILIQSRFDPSVRQIDTPLKGKRALEEYFSFVWDSALTDEIRKTAGRLSSVFLQLLFNLPVLGLSVYAGWITIERFVQGDVLPFDFFLHAFFAIGVSLFLSFFVFQAMVRFSTKKQRMETRALQTAREMTASEEWIRESTIAGQIKSILELGRYS
jgi:ribosome biogenesis GTPase A